VVLQVTTKSSFSNTSANVPQPLRAAWVFGKDLLVGVELEDLLEGGPSSLEKRQLLAHAASCCNAAAKEILESTTSQFLPVVDCLRGQALQMQVLRDRSDIVHDVQLVLVQIRQSVHGQQALQILGPGVAAKEVEKLHVLAVVEKQTLHGLMSALVDDSESRDLKVGARGR
jgi:hypothetical protein